MITRGVVHSPAGRLTVLVRCTRSRTRHAVRGLLVLVFISHYEIIML